VALGLRHATEGLAMIPKRPLSDRPEDLSGPVAEPGQQPAYDTISLPERRRFWQAELSGYQQAKVIAT
jgi:hypothetical protein